MTAPSFLATGSIFVLAFASHGCTIRYSQTLVGSIERVSSTPISNQDIGTELGLGSAAAVITFSEPIAPDELLTVPCEIANAQVDYRGEFYAYYVAVNFPQTSLVTYCIEP